MVISILESEKRPMQDAILMLERKYNKKFNVVIQTTIVPGHLTYVIDTMDDENNDDKIFQLGKAFQYYYDHSEGELNED